MARDHDMATGDSQCEVVVRRPFPHPDDAYLDLILVCIADADYRPYVVWTHNRSLDSYYHGDYYATEDEARIGFWTRYRELPHV